ncbi:MAG: hypothetical protein SGJ01_04775 [Gemmatimonadota bacterium]|nr:hypothetical protein [Gemmatimonadota bacterium]
MFRNLFGFALLAVVAWFGLRLLFGVFDIALGLLGSLLWLAFLGFLVYLVLRVFAPRTADKVKETISGKTSTSL